jgi:hypothetical protein
MCNYPSHRITPPEGRPSSDRTATKGDNRVTPADL